MIHYFIDEMSKERKNPRLEDTIKDASATTQSSIGFRFWSQGRVENLFVQGLASWDLSTDQKSDVNLKTEDIPLGIHVHSSLRCILAIRVLIHRTQGTPSSWQVVPLRCYTGLHGRPLPWRGEQSRDLSSECGSIEHRKKDLAYSM